MIKTMTFLGSLLGDSHGPPTSGYPHIQQAIAMVCLASKCIIMYDWRVLSKWPPHG